MKLSAYYGALAAGSLLAFSGCSGSSPNDPNVKNPGDSLARIDIAGTKKQLAVNEGLQLTASGTGKSGLSMLIDGLVWTSSDSSKAEVDSNGLVTGRGTGSAVITATAQGVSATYELKVQGALHNHDIAESETWRAADNPHLVTTTVSVGSEKNPVIVIEPGVRVEFARDASLLVGATGAAAGIQINGTEQAPVLFTADIGTPQKGHYNGFALGEQLLGGSKVAWLEMEWAKHTDGIGTEGCLVIEGESTKPVLDHVTVRDCAVVGVELGNGAAFGAGSKNLTVKDSDADALLFDHNANAVGSTPPGSVFTGNQRDAIRVYAGQVSTDQTWADFGVPYVLEGEVDVYGTHSPTLTLAEGLTLRFGADAHLDVGFGQAGVLKAVGTQEKPITFTADADDPQPGHWYGIEFHPEALAASRMTWTIVEYAGGPNSDTSANIVVDQDKFGFITHSIIRHSSACGIRRTDSLANGFGTDFTAAELYNEFSDNAGGDQCGPD